MLVFLGNIIVNVDPLSNSLVTVIVPPWSSINPFVMVSPKPLPFVNSLFELTTWLKRSNILSIFSGGIPLPVSLISIVNVLSESIRLTTIWPFLFVKMLDYIS